MKNKIIEYQIEDWLGSDDTLQKALECLREIANGDYKPEEFRQDVYDYAGE